MEKQPKKKLIVFIFVMLVSAAAVFGFLKYRDSVKYKEYAGTYEMYSVFGDRSKNDYEYCRIILKANGDLIVKTKLKGIPAETRMEATYEIEDGKIYVYSSTFGIEVTETYDFVLNDDYEIHMLNVRVPLDPLGQQYLTYSMKLKRVSD